MSFLIAWIVVAVITAIQNFIDCNAIIYESTVYVVFQTTYNSRNNLRQYVKIWFMGSNLFGTYSIWGLFYSRKKNSNIIFRILFHVPGTSCIHPLTMALLLDSLWSLCTIHFNAICKCTNKNKNVTDSCGSWLRGIMQCVSNGCPLASVKDKFIIVQYQSVSPSPMFFNKKVFHHTSFHMRIFAYDARQSEIFDVSSISKNCTGYVNIFLHYFISEEFNLLFFSGIRSQYFVFFIIIIFAF